MNDVIVAFGDSITQRGQDPKMKGWVSQLINRYIRKLDVLNRGFAGYNTKSGCVMFPRIFPTTNGKPTSGKIKFHDTVVYKSAEELSLRADQEFGA
ncbi:Isoamyl acetate-hydrolyzing esterase 1-like protein, partial [Smittium culicis]